RVRRIAGDIQGGITDPLLKANAVVRYLQSRHGYSLSYDPTPGDQVSEFILGSSSAHCEYFASAAVILLRCMGVPSRYVVGYYAHEQTESGAAIVRQRDAHAWAECWIPGKGWIGVDATPGAGRPDRTPLPVWSRASEWLQDHSSAVRAAVLHLVAPAAMLAGLAAVVVMLTRRKRIRAVMQPDSYTERSDELVRLYEHFNLSCARRGISCPPSRLWSWRLAQIEEDERENAGAIHAAKEFVRIYNRARFGKSRSTDPDELRTLLRKMSSPPE
ncbi:MAG TPA: transglutaminase-like domain-containing protein, partial [Chthonomonadales bacterium]|nr:transglutaminase-like domain-containing protein [Chthonomonadales bacterium]